MRDCEAGSNISSNPPAGAVAALATKKPPSPTHRRGRRIGICETQHHESCDGIVRVGTPAGLPSPIFASLRSIIRSRPARLPRPLVLGERLLAALLELADLALVRLWCASMREAHGRLLHHLVPSQVCSQHEAWPLDQCAASRKQRWLLLVVVVALRVVVAVGDAQIQWASAPLVAIGRMTTPAYCSFQRAVVLEACRWSWTSMRCRSMITRACSHGNRSVCHLPHEHVLCGTSTMYCTPG